MRRVAASKKADRVLVLKRERRLVLKRGKRRIAEYRVALGRNPVGHKNRMGDGKTPEGHYRLDWRKTDSRFYRAIHISYPNPRDRRLADMMGVDPGGSIMIHGLPNGRSDIGPEHVQLDWTDGCIAVTNEEMDEIWALVDDGVPIEIRP